MKFTRYNALELTHARVNSNAREDIRNLLAIQDNEIEYIMYKIIKKSLL